MYKVFAILALLCVSFSAAQNPAVSLAITQSAVNNMKDAFMNFILSKIKAIPLPNFHYHNVEFEDLKISNPGFNSQDVTTKLEQGYILFEANEFDIELSGRADIHFLFHIHQGFTLKTSGSTLSLHLEPNFDGKLKYKVSNINFSVGHVHIEFSGFLGKIESWIVNTFSHDLSGTVQKEINKVIQNDISTPVNSVLEGTTTQQPLEAEDEADGAFAHFKFPEFLLINYTLIHSPDFETGYINMPLNGTIYTKDAPTRNIPFENTVTLPKVDSNQTNGIQLFFSEFVFNSALYNLHVDNKLKYNITAKSLPKGFPIQLTTSSLNTIFPHLKKTFGEGRQCYIQCGFDQSTYPTTDIIENGMSFNFPINCALYANDSNSNDFSLALDFTTDLKFSGDMSLNSTNNKLYFNLDTASVSNTKIVTSNIGTFDIFFLDIKINLALDGSKVVINEFFAKRGFPLPEVPNSKINLGKVAFKDGYVEASYNPTFKTYSL